MLDAEEERLIGLIEPRQRILQDVRVDGRVLWEFCADGLQLGFLLIARDGDTASLPGSDALLQASVIESRHKPRTRFSSRSCSGVGLSLYLYVLRTVCCSKAI